MTEEITKDPFCSTCGSKLDPPEWSVLDDGSIGCVSYCNSCNVPWMGKLLRRDDIQNLVMNALKKEVKGE